MASTVAREAQGAVSEEEMRLTGLVGRRRGSLGRGLGAAGLRRPEATAAVGWGWLDSRAARSLPNLPLGS